MRAANLRKPMQTARRGAPRGHHSQGPLVLTPHFTPESANGSQRACFGILKLRAHYLRPMRET